MKIPRIYPLALLPDMRRPYVTSSFRSRNPSRPDHYGCDLLYRYHPGADPVVKLGDGGASRDPAHPGDAKWWIPDGTCAIAASPGIVQLVGSTPTGFRIWIQHSDGMRTGYFHLRDVRVTRGQAVTLGHPLGLVGDNPRDIDVKHLHFEVSPSAYYHPIDPEIWLESARFLSR